MKVNEKIAGEIRKQDSAWLVVVIVGYYRPQWSASGQSWTRRHNF